MQTQADKARRLREWLDEFEPSVYLYDIEQNAFKELTYAEYCQFQEWEGEFGVDTVEDLLRWLDSRQASTGGAA